MSNVIDSIVTKKTAYPAKKQTGNTSFTFDTEGKIKPMNYKGKLLPSKIFPSPVEYAKDLKGDIVSIGKAAKGLANDHELGRINDLGMKIGSACLAGFLGAKTASKLPKTMEFVGPLTFFGAMSLWPKLTIQAPIKARTGVDVHQKYLDSQGRKKMLFLDPQYVLTDLYSKNDLEKMGDKLGVNQDIPDRDNYIKQRAQKTALQANTLWMMTAGPATPLMSGLLCNRLEQPITTLIEEAEILSSQKGIDKLLKEVDPNKEKNAIQKLLEKPAIKEFTGKVKDKATKISDKIASAPLERYLKKHADEEVTDALIEDLSREIGARRISKRSQKLGNAVVNKLKASKDVVNNKSVKPPLNIDIKEALRKAAKEEAAKLEALPANQRTESAEEIVDALKRMYENASTIIPDESRGVAYTNFQNLITEHKGTDITNHLMTNFKRFVDKDFDAHRPVRRVLGPYVGETLNQTANKPVVKLGSIADTVRSLKTASSKFGKEQRKLDRYISARVGTKESSHISNQWDRVCGSLLKSLNVSSQELKTLADSGDFSSLASSFEKLAADDAQYNKTVAKLMKLIGNYEARTGVDVFAGENGVIKQASKKINEKTFDALKECFGEEVAKQIQSETANTVIKHAENSAAGARNSFYRMINSLEVFKKASTGQLDEDLRSNLTKYVPELKDEALDKAVSKLVKISKKLVLDATTTDHIEKLTTQGYNLTTGEYKAVMETVFKPVFDDEGKTALIKTLEKSMGSDRAAKLAEGYQKYQENFIKTIANWKNEMTSALSYRVLDSDKVTSSLNGTKRANTVASEMTDAIKKVATKKYNTNKWLKIFGLSFAALTAVTLVAGLFFGRKGDVEKQVEKESKVNG